MLTKVKYSVLILAASLLLAHTFLPHSHHQDSSKTIIQKYNENDFFTFLLNIVSIDLGNNHLEKYNVSDSYFDFDQNIVIYFVILPQLIFNLISYIDNIFIKLYFNINDKVKQTLLFSDILRRGPPFLY